MKTMKEYEVQARGILNKRYPPPMAYYTTEITDTITQLMMLDALAELREMAQSFSFDHFGRLIVKAESD
jgi:hypothetical protein